MNTLLHKYIPEYNYNERHEIIVDCGQQKAFLITKELDIKPSLVTRVLLRLRGLPTKDLSLQGFIKNVCFIYLEEQPFSEFIINASQKNLSIYWNFNFDAVSAGRTKITTETRILCMTKRVKIFFSLYWFFIKPFSGMIRKEMLRLIKKECYQVVS
ncbi:MAG TPA: hypothetical protein VK498_07170 [Ferruginibacter sp.]|nr:hypothetical protein [Ferruginibacter sp.]